MGGKERMSCMYVWDVFILSLLPDLDTGVGSNKYWSIYLYMYNQTVNQSIGISIKVFCFIYISLFICLFTS